MKCPARHLTLKLRDLDAVILFDSNDITQKPGEDVEDMDDTFSSDDTESEEDLSDNGSPHQKTTRAWVTQGSGSRAVVATAGGSRAGNSNRWRQQRGGQ